MYFLPVPILQMWGKQECKLNLTNEKEGQSIYIYMCVLCFLALQTKFKKVQTWLYSGFNTSLVTHSWRLSCSVDRLQWQSNLYWSMSHHKCISVFWSSPTKVITTKLQIVYKPSPWKNTFAKFHGQRTNHQPSFSYKLCTEMIITNLLVSSISYLRLMLNFRYASSSF